MKLYFENSYNEQRVIAEPKNETEAIQEIYKFINKCNENKPEDKKFHSYYTRTWTNDEGLKVYDVGSWSERFLLEV